MAFLTDVATLSLTCFNRNEIEDMMQWHVLQGGNFIDTAKGTYAHLHDPARRLHFFHYLEDDGQEAGPEQKDVPWRLDLHADTGKAGNVQVSIAEDIKKDMVASQDARFNNLTPVLLPVEGREEPVTILVDLINKNMIPAADQVIDLNLNVSVLDMQFFANREDWVSQAGLSPDQAKEAPDMFPLGIAVNRMMQEKDTENMDDQAVALMRYAAEDLAINPIGLMNMNGTVESVEQIHLGNGLYNYLLALKTDLGVFRTVVPERFIQVEEVSEGNYITLIGFFSGIYIGEPANKEDKEKVVPIHPVH